MSKDEKEVKEMLEEIKARRSERGEGRKQKLVKTVHVNDGHVVIDPSTFMPIKTINIAVSYAIPHLAEQFDADDFVREVCGSVGLALMARLGQDEAKTKTPIEQEDTVQTLGDLLSKQTKE